MSQPRTLKRSLVTSSLAANSAIHGDSTPHKRRRQTNQALEALGQLVKDPSVDELDNKLNKNDILSLSLSRLLREKYWPSHYSYRDVQLTAGLNSSTCADDLNSFIIVLNPNGRIVLMSDNIESYLRKHVRALYPQLTSIYDCINGDDHESVRQVLSSTMINVEQRVICTWNLPRGKRPSRTHTESKPMLMTGHYFYFRNEENKQQEQEPLFVARCEQILSSTPNIPTNSNGVTSFTTLRFVLNDQLHINEISTNTESLLGYRADELIDQSINRLIASEHLHILEQARQNCIVGQHYTTMNVLDLYTRDGHRLTFLCNTHMLIEGRRKAMKLGFIAQLIDPSILYECVMYANKQNLDRLKNTVQQESTRQSTIDPLSTSTQNILRSPNEQYLSNNEMPAVCPVANLPQRRKRRRVQAMNIKREPMNFPNTVQETPQMNNDFNDYQNSSPESFSSSGSPIQELGWTNGFLSSMEDLFPYDKFKCIEDFPSIDDVNNVFGINMDQSFSLFTPTMSSFNFFP